VSGTRVDVTAMCLTCGATRHARADQGKDWRRLVRRDLTCKSCHAVTRHCVADKTPGYGEKEDGMRFLCAEVDRLFEEISAMPHVDVRWQEMPWCLAHSPVEPPLSWFLATGEEEFRCICDEHPPIYSAGAQPAGWIVEGADEGDWLIELDLRQPRERLGSPLREVRTALRAGEAKPGYLRHAYAVSVDLYSSAARSRRVGEETER